MSYTGNKVIEQLNREREMREIKFRAWDKERKEIMYDVFWINFSNPMVVACSVEKYSRYLDCPEECELMQYTGLKDKNGKEIYDGDIVKYSYKSNLCSDGDIESYFKIGFYNGSFLQSNLANIDNAEQYDLWYDWDELEVIGNIYENPELVK